MDTMNFLENSTSRGFSHETWISELCGQSFQDGITHVKFNDPKFEMCMERTLLVWVPCGLVWLCSPAYVIILRCHQNKPLPWTLLTNFKLVMFFVLLGSAVLELMSLIDLMMDGFFIPVIAVFATVTLIATYILETGLTLIGRWYGSRTGALPLLYWFLMFLCGLPQLRTVITGNGSVYTSGVMASTYVLQYGSAVLLFIANCFADNPPMSPHEKLHPEQTSSFLNQIAFHWCSSIVWKGWKGSLTHDDLWKLPGCCTAFYCHRFWNAASRRPSKSVYGSVLKKLHALLGNILLKCKKTHSQHEERTSVLQVITRAYFWPFIYATMLYMISKVFLLFMPQLLSLLIKFTSSTSEPTWHGYVYCSALLIVAMSTTLIKNAFYYKDQIIILQLRTSLMLAVYQKTLKLSASSRSKYTIGEITNLMAVDSQRISETVYYLNHVWGGPLIIGAVLYQLWQILGPSVLAGVAILILLVPVNSVIASKIKSISTSQIELQDRRIKMLNEVISGIKVLKLYAWETAFGKQVESLRKAEIAKLRRTAYLEAAVSFIWLTTPYLVALTTFTTYLLVSEENVLNAQTVFVSISLFNIMQSPLQQLPTVLAQCIQAKISLERMNKFFSAVDAEDYATLNNKETSKIAISEGYFSWDCGTSKSGCQLKEISFDIGCGKLVSVVGTVGSGKTSLISSLLGDMVRVSGSVTINGRIAYVPQQPWLWHGTVRENIVWGMPYDRSWYQTVIKACALQLDFSTFAAGDLTEIGEKGINLSGGQKQRICLARAVYSVADVVLLDDPLSAVDAQVGKQIFNGVLGPQGILKHKTRVLVTHSLSVLRQSDLVIVIRDGQVVRKGIYAQLLKENGDFSQFLLQRVASKNADETEELCGKLESDRLHQGPSEKLSEKQDFENEEQVFENLDLQIPSAGVDIRKAGSPGCCISVGCDQDASDSDDRKTLLQVEEVKSGKIKWDVFCYYAKAMGLFLAVLPPVVFTIAQVFQVGSNIWLTEWSSSMVKNNVSDKTGLTRMQFILGYGAFGVGQAIFFYIGSLSVWLGCLRAGMSLHQKLLQNVLHLPVTFFDANPVGRIMNRFSTEIGTLDTQFPCKLSGAAACLAQVATTLVVIVAFNPLVAVAVVPIMGFYYFIHTLYIPTSRQLKRIESVAKSPVFSQFVESVQGVTTIRAFRKEKKLTYELYKKIDHANIATLASVACDRWLEVRLEFIGNMITFAAAIFAVACRGSVSPGIVGLSITYALNVTVTLNWLVRMSSAVAANIVSVERIKQYADEPTEAVLRHVECQASSWWPERGSITFCQYSTCYRPGLSCVLHDINIDITPGEKIGIVGRTGAGKSSLTMALFRILEASSGSIVIDGVNIAALSLMDLRSRLTVIPQEPMLFSGSLQLNLDPCGIYREEELWRALSLAHLGSFMEALPSGLQTQVEESGSNMSIGQRQLICLARAILRKSKILVLDEATAAVDPETDSLIQATIRTLFRDCTVLTIAHRLNTIMDYDRIIVLEQGQVVDFDTPSSLLSRKDSVFYIMARDAGLI